MNTLEFLRQVKHTPVEKRNPQINDKDLDYLIRFAKFIDTFSVEGATCERIFKSYDQNCNKRH